MGWINQAARKIINNLGFTILYSKYMPFGIEVNRDIKKLLPHHRFTTIFDIGANVGNTTKKFNADFPEAKTFAFEPIKNTFEILTNNVKHLKNVNCYQYALGSIEESRLVYHQSSSEWNSLVESINQEVIPNAAEVVQVKRLEDFAKTNLIEYIDILKTDTEGFDFEVIRGAEKYLKNNRVLFVYSEVGFKSGDMQHTNFYELNNYLESLGFYFISLYDQARYGNLGEYSYCNALFINPKAKIIF